MRLFVRNKLSGEKTYLRATARSRSELAHVIGGQLFSVNGHWYTIWDVEAEAGFEGTAVGAVVGGLIGAILGGGGVIAGGLLGGIIGRSKQEQEKMAVEVFNRSFAI